MAIPKDYKYTKEHEWLKVDGNAGTIGITDHAQDELGDIVFVELPGVGAQIEAGKPFGSVESVKAVSDVYAPVSGTDTSAESSGGRRSSVGETSRARARATRSSTSTRRWRCSIFDSADSNRGLPSNSSFAASSARVRPRSRRTCLRRAATRAPVWPSASTCPGAAPGLSEGCATKTILACSLKSRISLS